MKRRISNALTAMAMGTIIFLCIIMTFIYYSFYSAQTQNNVKALARFFVGAGSDYTTLSEEVTKSYPYPIRITVINSGGAVIFDTAKKPYYDNHLSRPEIEGAFETGNGEATRTSDTIGKKAYYYAEQYSAGTVVRFSVEMESIISIFISILPFIILAAFIVVTVATIIAGMLSKSVMRPVAALAKSLDVLDMEESGLPEMPYDELREVAHTVRKLKSKLEKYIDQLKRERSTINIITDNMVEGMILLSDEENILSVNKSATQILNKEFTLDAPKNILQLTRNTELLAAITQAKDAGASTALIQGNDNKHYRLFASKVKDEIGGCILLLVDVTEAVRVEQMRHDFAANVSHELKTPLTTIKGFGEMLSAGVVADKDEAMHYGGIIFREGERLLLLINDIMRLSEIEDGMKENASVDLFACACSVETILKGKAKEKSVTIGISGETAIVCGSESYLIELILNLVENAIKYNNPGGRVDVLVTNGERNVILIVEDNGIGIPKEHQERIFERFYRVDKSRSKQTGGTGLGLSIVKHIVLYHRGSITLTSEENVGTKIVVTLPR